MDVILIQWELMDNHRFTACPGSLLQMLEIKIIVMSIFLTIFSIFVYWSNLNISEVNKRLYPILMFLLFLKINPTLFISSIRRAWDIYIYKVHYMASTHFLFFGYFQLQGVNILQKSPHRDKYFAEGTEQAKIFCKSPKLITNK